MTQKVPLAPVNLAVLERIDRDLHPLNPLVERRLARLPLRIPPLVMINDFSSFPEEGFGGRGHESGEGVRDRKSVV
mgnify:FL=1